MTGTKQFLGVLGASLGVLITVLVLRTLTLRPREDDVTDCSSSDKDFIPLDVARSLRFKKAIQIQTISHGLEYESDAIGLSLLKDHIFDSFPNVHSSKYVKVEIIANFSLLYTITGSDPSLRPYLILGHLDVVPIASPKKWSVDPFAGTIKDDFFYGRGTIDAKQIVLGSLEALEFILKSGRQPVRSFIMAYGHDEEIRGYRGAAKISEILQNRVDQFEYILDEGATITTGVMTGLTQQVAFVGVTEKGSLSLNISVSATGGHSSMPSHESCIGILANAIKRLEENPFPSFLGSGAEMGMLEHTAPHMGFGFRLVLSNVWLFSPIISWIMSRKPSANAILRTTTAVTMINGGIKENVLATDAWAVINHRVYPTQSLDDVLERDRRIINDDRVKIKVLQKHKSHPLSPYCDTCYSYQTIKNSIRQAFGSSRMIVAPCTLMGNTDSFHYLSLSKNVYRFSPTILDITDLPRFHGVDERISIKNYEQAINFYYHLMVNSDKKDLKPLHQHSDEL